MRVSQRMWRWWVDKSITVIEKAGTPSRLIVFGVDRFSRPHGSINYARSRAFLQPQPHRRPCPAYWPSRRFISPPWPAHVVGMNAVHRQGTATSNLYSYTHSPSHQPILSPLCPSCVHGQLLCNPRVYRRESNLLFPT